MKKILLLISLFLFIVNTESQNYTGPIIDMHIHAYTMKSAPEMFWHDHPNPLKNETYKGVKTPKEQRIETFKKFEEYNIVKALTSNGHLWYDYDSDRILISGRNQPIDSLKALHKKGKLYAIGELAPFYGGIKANHESQKRFFDLAEELKIPLGFHIMPGGPPGGIYHFGLDKMRVSNANPKQLEEVLISHPNLKVFVMHGGWPYLDDMKAMMYAHPQLYIDTAAISWILPKAEFHYYLKGLINAGFGKRIMFGSDQMTWPETIGIAVDAVNSAEFLTLEQKEDIFYDNAAKFLGLTKEEIENHKD